MGIFRRTSRPPGRAGGGAPAPDTDSPPHPADADAVQHSFHTERFRRQRALLVGVEPVPYKSIADEFRGGKDLAAFFDHDHNAHPLILLDTPQDAPAPLVAALVDALVDAGQLPQDERNTAVDSLVGTGFSSWILQQDDRRAQSMPHPAHSHGHPPSAPTANSNTTNTTNTTSTSTPDDETSDALPLKPLSPSNDNLEDAHWHHNIQGPSFIVAMGKLPPTSAVETRISAMARLAHPANLGAVDHAPTRFVAIVLGPSAKQVKETKSVFEMARNFASLFSDNLFYLDASRATSVPQICNAAKDFLVAETQMASDGEQKQANAQIDDLNGLAKTGRFAGGLMQDIQRRRKVYISDFTDGLYDPRSLLKYFSAIVWLFFAVLMPIVGLGSLNQEKSKGDIGVIEAIVAQAVGGVLFAIFAGNPLVIVRTTGPISAYIAVLASWAKALDIEDKFLPFYAWTGIWTALFLAVIAVTDLSYLIKYVGSFTEQIFGLLISALFIGEFVMYMIDVAGRQESPETMLIYSLLLGFGTFLIAYKLMIWRRSFLLLPIIRTLISDFGAPVAIVIMSGFNALLNNEVVVESLDVPIEAGLRTTTGRNWFVPLLDLPVGMIFLSILPGILVALLFFIDENVSALLVNKPENRLKKSPGYHLDMFVVALLVLGTSLFGLPWVHASLPHSPMHARQLADVEEYEAHGRRYERVLRARETRLTGLIAHILIGLSLFAKGLLAKIPVAVMQGFFLWIGIAALDGNQMWERTLLIFTEYAKYPPNHFVRRVPVRRVHIYTAIQITLLVFLWFIKSNLYLGDTLFNTGVLFPFVIALFVPIYRNLMPKFFSRRELQALAEEPEDISNEGITV